MMYRNQMADYIFYRKIIDTIYRFLRLGMKIFRESVTQEAHS